MQMMTERERRRSLERKIRNEKLQENIPDEAIIKKKKVHQIKKEYGRTIDDVLLHSVRNEPMTFEEYENRIKSLWEEDHGNKKDEIFNQETHQQ